MKKLLLLIFLAWLSVTVSHAQKKYEMVVEKTDGSTIVVNTEDIIRTFFRERTEEPEKPDVPSSPVFLFNYTSEAVLNPCGVTSVRGP